MKRRTLKRRNFLAAMFGTPALTTLFGYAPFDRVLADNRLVILPNVVQDLTTPSVNGVNWMEQVSVLLDPGTD